MKLPRKRAPQRRRKLPKAPSFSSDAWWHCNRESTPVVPTTGSTHAQGLQSVGRLLFCQNLGKHVTGANEVGTQRLKLLPA